MHAVIQRASHSAEIFVPRDWVTIASVAKVIGQPYRVCTMASSELVDFKSMSCHQQSSKTRTDLTAANGLTGYSVSGFSSER